MTYKVKQVLGSDTASKTTGITRRQTTCGTVSGSSVVTLSLTTDIEIGNYVFGTGIPDNARVIDITINQFVILDKVATATGNPTLTFINHRGFVKKVIVNANASGKTIFASTSTPLLASSPNHTTTHTDVQKDMVVIGSGINAVRIVDVNGPSGSDGGNIFLADNISASQNDVVYIYQSRGLKDNSLITFCDKLATSPTVQCLIATSAVLSGNVIPVTTPSTVGGIQSFGAINTGNATNWNVQGFNFKKDDDGNSVTTITSIDTTADTITLNHNIEKPIVSGTQFTATTNSDDRQLCCPPTDTSPPFLATEEGLNTTVDGSGNPERPNLRFENGNLVFDQLTIQNNGSNIQDADYTSGSVNRKIDIRSTTANGGTGKTYKILATT